MVQAIKKALLLTLCPVLFGISLTGCFDRGGDGCKETYITVLFSDEYKDWFKKAGINNTSVAVQVQTDSGLKETLSLSKLNHQEGILQPANNCNHIMGQTVGLGYNSALYGASISLKLLQQREGEKPVLHVYNYYQEGENYYMAQMLVSLGNTTQYPLILSKSINGQGQPETIQTNAFPELTMVDSVVVGNKVYRQVYKLSNPYLKLQGAAFVLTDFFIDKDYGLVQYAQKDGTTWQLQF
jgi:hypothetical protein